jgi:hypothetical protein
MNYRSILAALPLPFLVASCYMLNCVRGEGELASQKRSHEPFTSITLDAGMQVVVTQGSPRSVVVMAQENLLPFITTSVDESGLHVGANRCVAGSLPITVHVTLPRLDGVTVTGSGSVVATTPLEMTGERVALQVDGSGSISLPIEGANLRSIVNGSGSIRLKGAVPHHSVTINGSGDVDAYERVPRVGTRYALGLARRIGKHPVPWRSPSRHLRRWIRPSRRRRGGALTLPRPDRPDEHRQRRTLDLP